MSYATTPNNIGTPLGAEGSPTASDSRIVKEEGAPRATKSSPQGSKWKKVAIGGAVLVLLGLVVGLPVGLTVGKKGSSGGQSGGSGGSSGGSGGELPAPQPNGATTGGDGSTVVMEDGTSFTYKNKFGGYWEYDPAKPFANGARAQSWTPALNETWKWGVDTVRGVNIGGWLVTEPFIVPALYQKYQNSVTFPNGSAQIIDEWKLVTQMKSDGSIGDLENHYATFYTEQDFAEIAGAGLNWVRLPFPFWAIETVGEEPYLGGVQWKYVLKAIGWARKYGLRINLDFHSHPGSQNGWNHSGLNGGPLGVNWLNGVMGIANAQRSLDYIRIVAEFISQDEYKDVVPMFGIVNEPRIMQGTHVLEPAAVQSFYYEAYKVIREVTGIGEGKGPMISIHDGFLDFSEWNTFLNGADRLALDTHPYFAFDGANVDPLASYVPKPCARWGDAINTTQSTFGVITAGECSLAINDCGLFVNGVNLEPTYAGAGGCDAWDHWETWDATTKADLKNFAMTTMDALQNWFFWTWKIGPSATDNAVRAPFWSYKLGVENGWLPEDPREAIGACAAQGGAVGIQFNGQMQPWQTGGAGAGQIEAAQTATLTWPPTSLGPSYPVAAYLPTYTPTGTHITLAGPAATGAGDGWTNDQDQAPLMVPIASCDYPEAYQGATMPQPVTPFCGGAATAVVPPIPTEVDDGSALTDPALGATATTVPGVLPTSTTPERRWAPRGSMPTPML